MTLKALDPRSRSTLVLTLFVCNQCFSLAGWRGSGSGPGLGRSDWSESRCTGPEGDAGKKGSCFGDLGRDRTQARRGVTEVYLDLAWAFTQASLPVGSEHVDHLVQASLQGAKHLPRPLLFATVTGRSHIQGPRSEEQTKLDLQSRPNCHPQFDP